MRHVLDRLCARRRGLRPGPAGPARPGASRARGRAARGAAEAQRGGREAELPRGAARARARPARLRGLAAGSPDVLRRAVLGEVAQHALRRSAGALQPELLAVKRFAVSALRVAVVAFVRVQVYLYLAQDSVIFFPQPLDDDMRAAVHKAWPDAEEIMLATARKSPASRSTRGSCPASRSRCSTTAATAAATACRASRRCSPTRWRSTTRSPCGPASTASASSPWDGASAAASPRTSPRSARR